MFPLVSRWFRISFTVLLVLSHEAVKGRSSCQNIFLAQETTISTSAAFRVVYFGAEIKVVVSFNFQWQRSQEKFRSVACMYLASQSCTRFKDQVEAPKSQIKRHASFHIVRSWFTLGVHALWVLASPLPFSSEVLFPKVTNQVPCILSDQTVIIYFESSGFESFSFSPLAFIQSVFSGSPLIVVACPSKSNGGRFLWDFGLREF